MDLKKEARVNPMVKRTTWILLIILAILVGFALIFQRYQAKKSETIATSTPTAAPVMLYNLSGEEVDQIKIASANGEQIEFDRHPSTKNWMIANYPADQADSFQIESVSAQLFSLQAAEILTQTLPLDAIGLATPAYTITMTSTAGSQLVTYIGSVTPIGSGYYARVGTRNVVIVDKVVLDDVIKLLTTPPLVPTETPAASATGLALPLPSGTPGTPAP